MATEPRVLPRRFGSPAELRAAFEALGVTPEGTARMLPKAEILFVQVEGATLVQANILKQEMLAAGGDAAVRRETVLGGEGRTDVILFGTRPAFEAMLRGLEGQPFSLPKLGRAVRSFLSRSLPPRWEMGRRALPFRSFPLVMGILNVTPDSFSDGGRFDNPAAAFERAAQMVSAGVDVIDVGGQSTRPYARPVSAAEEMDRVLPVVERIRASFDVPISVDTWYPEVARAALDAGADAVNDVTALSSPAMLELAAERRCGVVLMHMKGTPGTMQDAPHYHRVVEEVAQFLLERAAAAEEAGVPSSAIVIDPGIGFGKTPEHNLQLLRRAADLRALGYRLLIGHSRKSFIGALTSRPVSERDPETLALSLLLASRGCADIIRVHDVESHVRALSFLEKTR